MNKKEILKKLKWYIPSKLYNDLLTDNGVEFIKTEKEIKVDGLKGVNHYKIVVYYNQKHEDERGEWWTLEGKLIDEFDYSWDDIEADGGISEINKDINEYYGVVA